MLKEIQLWRMPHQDGVEFFCVRSLNAPIPRQVSFDCKLVYFERGAKRFRYRHNACTAACGDLLFIPPGEAYEADAPDDATTILRILHLPEAVFADLLPNNRIHRRVGCSPLPPFVSDPRVIQRFRRLHQKPDTFASELEQQTQLLLLLEALQTSPADQGKLLPAPHSEERTVRCLKQYIEAHYAEKITLAQLAHLTGLNAAYLCRLFTQTVGMPPHAYHLAVRIDRTLSAISGRFGRTGRAADRFLRSSPLHPPLSPLSPDAARTVCPTGKERTRHFSRLMSHFALFPQEVTSRSYFKKLPQEVTSRSYFKKLLQKTQEGKQEDRKGQGRYDRYELDRYRCGNGCADRGRGAGRQNPRV